MISTNEFKNNMTIEFDNNLYQIIEFLHVKPARGGAFVRTKLRNLRTGSIIDHTFNAGVRVKRAHITRDRMQYLYANGPSHVFMNNETYDQIEINETQIKNELKYIYEGMNVEVLFYNNSEVLGLKLPDNVTLKVQSTEPGSRGDTKTNALKDAIMETGLLVKVPLFINEGEKLVISTHDGSYVSREK